MTASSHAVFLAVFEDANPVFLYKRGAGSSREGLVRDLAKRRDYTLRNARRGGHAAPLWPSDRPCRPSPRKAEVGSNLADKPPIRAKSPIKSSTSILIIRADLNCWVYPHLPSVFPPVAATQGALSPPAVTSIGSLSADGRRGSGTLKSGRTFGLENGAAYQDALPKPHLRAIGR